jgi:hypothetical protein
MKRNCVLSLLVAALSVSPLMAQSPNSRTPSKPTRATKDLPKDLPLKGTVTGNSCAAYGPGFVKLEGSDTCVQLGGSIGIGVGGSTGGRR